MKTNRVPDFPEKVYIPRDAEYPQSPDIWWEKESSEGNIEYIRTDTFIEKVCKFLDDRIKHDSIDYPMATVHLIEDFKNYMKGE